MSVEAPFRTEVTVTGMTCQHCVMSVTEELTEISGVSAVDVELGSGPEGSRVTILADREIDRDEIAGAVTVAGFALGE